MWRVLIYPNSERHPYHNFPIYNSSVISQLRSNLFYQCINKKIMKSVNKIFASLMIYVVLSSIACSDDDEPIPINEEEVITTLTVTLAPQSGGSPIFLQSRDLDGDGPNPPVVTVSGPLQSGQVYNGSIELLNETESPAEDITEEVEEEDDEHQFFYLIGGTLDLTTDYTDQDDDGNPIGLTFTATAGAASNGILTVVLRHEPDKDAAGVSDGEIANAGGETDISQDFSLEIQ